MTKMKFQCLKCQCTMTQTSPLVPVQFSFYNFVKKYKLPQKARDDLLKLVKQHCPEEAKQQFPKTYSKMLKLLIPVLKKVEKQTVCAACNKVISSSSTLCENGHVDRQENSFFYIIPLEPQLKMLLEGELSLSDFTISTPH